MERVPPGGGGGCHRCEHESVCVGGGGGGCLAGLLHCCTCLARLHLSCARLHLSCTPAHLQIVLMVDAWAGMLGSSDPDYLHPTAGDLEVRLTKV